MIFRADIVSVIRAAKIHQTVDFDFRTYSIVGAQTRKVVSSCEPGVPELGKASAPCVNKTVDAAAVMKTQPTFPAKALSAEERNVLTARIGALLDENNRLLRELASVHAERDALERALNAVERNQKRELNTKAVESIKPVDCCLIRAGF